MIQNSRLFLRFGNSGYDKDCFVVKAFWDGKTVTPLEPVDLNKTFTRMNVLFLAPDFNCQVASKVSLENGNFISKDHLHFAKARGTNCHFLSKKKTACTMKVATDFLYVDDPGICFSKTVYHCDPDKLYQIFFYSDGDFTMTSYHLDNGIFTVREDLKISSFNPHCQSYERAYLEKGWKSKKSLAKLYHFDTFQQLLNFFKDSGFPNLTGEDGIYDWEGNSYKMYSREIPNSGFPGKLEVDLYPFSDSQIPIYWDY